MLLEMTYFSKKFLSILSGLNQLTGSNGGFRKSVKDLDELWNASEQKLFGQSKPLISPDCFIFMKDGVMVENILKTIVEEAQIKPDYALYRLAMKISNSYTEININSIFVTTMEINEEKPYHEFFMARAREETVSFGTLALYDWFNFFCSISNGDWVELRYIAGLVMKSLPKPLFIIRKKDFSDIKHISLFYNIVNIVESLLNLSELRMSLIGDGYIRINRKRFSLHEILNELALKLCVDPKKVMQKLRTALYCTVRFAGVDASEPDYINHIGSDPINRVPASRLSYAKYDKKFTDKFRNANYMRESFRKTDETFDELQLYKLKELSVEIRRFQFINNEGEVLTTSNDLAIGCSFFLNIIRIPGFGRASKYATAPRSKQERQNRDYGGIDDYFKRNILLFHRKAVENFTVTSNANFVHRFLSFLKTTSSGMDPVEVDVVIEDKSGVRTQTIKGKKKLLTAALYGDDLLSRKMLSMKMDKQNPGKTGTRDVPGKPTRAIYPIRLTTLGAMIVSTYHIVKYVSTSSGKTPLYGGDLTSDYISSGSESTTGVRISDNLNTITASGSSDFLCIDIDMSNYDSCCVDGNFRKPFVQALHEIGIFDRNNEKYGKDGLSWNEMVDYGFGSEYLSHTYWDAGRRPMFVLKEEHYDKISMIDSEIPLDLIKVGDDIEKLKVMTGCKKLLPSHSYYIIRDNIVPLKYLDYFYSGYVRDGSDLLFMTSEASGELTTLAMNSIMNLSIQQALISSLKKTKFGKCLDIKTHQAVGDDITILCRIISTDFESSDIDDFLLEIQRLVDLYGFEISLDKTFLCYGQSEYVQTYGIRGLFIPKDQILLIGSERPRRITDPLAYLESFKRLLCTKVSRGMNHAASILIFLYVFRRLMTVDLRRHQVKEIGVKAFYCGGQSLQIKTLKVLRNKSDDFGKLTDIFRFVPTIAKALLPKSSGGSGLFINAINLVVTDSLFIHNLNQLDVKTRFYLYSCYCFFKSRYQMKPLQESSNIKVDLHHYKLFSMDGLFGEKYMKDWSIMRNIIDLGRLNSENVPKSLVRKGVIMENFMIGINFLEEEYETEKYVMSLSNPDTRISHNEDQVLLNFEFEFERIERSYSPSFLQGLDTLFQNMITISGTKTVGRVQQSKIEAVRRILFRDPVLNLVHGSETIVSILDQYDVNTADDMVNGTVLLYRMGMNYSIAQQIVSAYVDTGSTHFSDDTIGACTDDLSSLFDWMNEERFNAFAVPQGISSSMKYRLFILGLQYGFIRFLMSESRTLFIPTSAKVRSLDEIKALRKTTLSSAVGFPRMSEFHSAQAKRKNALKFQAALLGDCLDT